MGRVSRAQAQDNRERVVATASRMFREQGTGVKVADLLKSAGLTHGGFYKLDFESRGRRLRPMARLVRRCQDDVKWPRWVLEEGKK